MEVEILEGAMCEGSVHLLWGTRAVGGEQAGATAQGESSYILLGEYTELRRQILGQRMWAGGILWRAAAT